MTGADRSCGVLVIGDGPAGRMAAAAARAAGVDVVMVPAAAAWGAFAPDEIAVLAGGASVVLRPRQLILAQPAHRRADGALVPETTLARALGVPQEISPTAAGTLRSVTDAAGRTGIPGVWSIPGDGTPRLARAQARVAGNRAATQLGATTGATPGATPGAKPGATSGATPDPRAEAALRRALAAEPPQPPAPPPDLRDDATACACENRSVADIRAAIAAGACSVPAIKRATRAGMGLCQGRECFHILHALAGDAGTEARHTAPRAPLHPVPIRPLLAQATAGPAPIARPAVTTWRTVPPAAGPQSCDVLVIGAGVVGLCAALHLAEAGRDVLIVDRAEPGLAASTANAGSLHVQLIPADMDGAGMDGADPGPLGEALALGPRSIALWRGLAARAGETLGIRTEGGLILAATPDDLAWLARKVAFERSRGIDSAVIGANELANLAPALSRTYVGAAYCADEGQMDPLRGTMALIRLVRAAGIRIAAGVEVTALHADGPAWRAETPHGAIRAGQVLNAAGAHAGRVGQLAGLELPVRAVVQQVIATAATAPMLRQLVAQARSRLSLKQKDGGQVVVGGGWPGDLGADGATRLRRTSIQGSLWTAAQAMPGLAALTMVRAWTGLTVHLDRGPLLSDTPGHPGLFHAVTSNGYTLGPIAAQLAGESMLGRGKPPAAFSL